MSGGLDTGDWCWFTRHASPCRVIERQDVWGEVAYRMWLPAKNAVVRARSVDLASLPKGSTRHCKRTRSCSPSMTTR